MDVDNVRAHRGHRGRRRLPVAVRVVSVPDDPERWMVHSLQEHGHLVTAAPGVMSLETDGHIAVGRDAAGLSESRSHDGHGLGTVHALGQVPTEDADDGAPDGRSGLNVAPALLKRGRGVRERGGAAQHRHPAAQLSQCVQERRARLEVRAAGDVHLALEAADLDAQKTDPAHGGQDLSYRPVGATECRETGLHGATSGSVG